MNDETTHEALPADALRAYDGIVEYGPVGGLRILSKLAVTRYQQEGSRFARNIPTRSARVSDGDTYLSWTEQCSSEMEAVISHLNNDAQLRTL